MFSCSNKKSGEKFFFYLEKPTFAVLKCPGGEIGRRTVFRSQRSQGCAGSNPVLGTYRKKMVGNIPAIFLLGTSL